MSDRKLKYRLTTDKACIFGFSVISGANTIFGGVEVAKGTGEVALGVASAPESAGAGLAIAAKGGIELKKGVEKLDRSWDIGKKAKNAYKQYNLDKETLEDCEQDSITIYSSGNNSGAQGGRAVDFGYPSGTTDQNVIVNSSMYVSKNRRFSGASSFKSLIGLETALSNVNHAWKLEVNLKTLQRMSELGLGFNDDEPAKSGGHCTIYPLYEMTLGEFRQKARALAWKQIY